MTTAIRQRKLFVAEDFRAVFRAFTVINFASFDFDTLRSAMIDYIRINFPEDFNDWIESSEFVALIELLAYLGQTLAFRMDLNTRENFLETAERRESILRLARLISFNPSRNFPATGLVKIIEISTNESIIDSNGNNLANQTIVWNDPINPDWFEQFILVINAILNSTSQFGTPIKDGTVGGIKTQLYQMNNDSSANRVFPFSTSIGGETIAFEVVNPDFTNGEVFFEREPDPEDQRHIIFRNDGAGNASPNTGFFFLFKQGNLLKQDFQINIPIENRLINIDNPGINNIDVFVQEIDNQGLIIEKWTKVPTLIGNNVIFNSLEKNERNIFNDITRINDQINIRFADGRFGNVPTGLFRIWFRESNGKRYQIRPEEMRDIQLDIPYLDKVNNTLFFSSFTFALQETVTNSAPTESSTQIQERAPQIFSTQDRMVNGEDYNVFPLRNAEAAKIKATNRIHSGFSRHIDINDPTGFSQNVNLFGEDGLLYFEENLSLEELALPTSLTSAQILAQIILPLIQELERRHFFYFHYDRFEPSTSDTGLFPNPIARVTGSIIGATTTVSDSIFINGTEVVFNSGTDINSAILDIDGESIPGIVASNDTNRLQIETNNNTSIVLLAGVGTALADLGLTAGTFDPEPLVTFWRKATESVNSSTGRLFTELVNSPETPIEVGSSVAGTSEFFIQEGALLKFQNAGFVSVISIAGDGDTILANGDGAIQLAEDVDNNDVLEQILLPFRTLFSDLETNQIISQIAQSNTFGLRYDQATLTWEIITGDNLAPEDQAFDLSTAGDVTGLNIDTTWLVRTEFSPTNWRFISRGLDYIFESDIQIRFFQSSDQKIVDPQSGVTIKDFIKILKINSSFEVDFITPSTADFQETDPVVSLNEDFLWNVEDVFVEKDGFIDPRKIKVTFTDSDEDGVPDDPTIFEVITKIDNVTLGLDLVDEIPDETELFWEAFTNTDGFQEFRPSIVVRKVFNTEPANFLLTFTPTGTTLASFEATFTVEPLTLDDGDVVFFRNTGNFYRARIRVGVDEFEDVTSLYFMRRGRNNFFFQWKHFATPDRRIDPAITNVIDMYVLTTTYDTEIRQWIDDNELVSDQPDPPSTEDLRILFAEETQNKMLSDEIIFHPVLYKVLFGTQAPEELQARFKITKVPETEVSDGEIKSRVIGSINEFFAINNWDFGETFYYTELAAFIHQQLATVIASVVVVPLDEESNFGTLFQVRSEPNEVFISSAKVSDVQIVGAFTDDILRIGS